ncbi:hypothetical protein COCNU_07G011620 [Cocos nucifera]|uniref:Uncharacterized protein n=1 Tax=Cocos nucifera TaxID=13894 RepID=A0A8K0IFQ6_COCNU|nr:hypothetical protein COCNU_07G011620 [Cocos nucifera]
MVRQSRKAGVMARGCGNGNEGARMGPRKDGTGQGDEVRVVGSGQQGRAAWVGATRLGRQGGAAAWG